MKTVLAGLLVLCTSLAAYGETVQIRSGEHPDHSRLVLDFQSRPGWSVGVTEFGYEIRFDRDDITFDLNRVFEFIPRTRIAQVSQDGQGSPLRLTLACDTCHIDAFELREASLVIDIRDGPADTEAVRQQVEADGFAIGEAFPEVANEVIFDPSATVVLAPPPETQRFAGVVLPRPWASGSAVGARYSPASPRVDDPQYFEEVRAINSASFNALTDVSRQGDTGDETAAAPDAIAAGGASLMSPAAMQLSDEISNFVSARGAVDAIARELSRAGNQGLLAVAPVGQVQPDPLAPAPDPIQPEPFSLGGSSPNLQVRTSIDRDNAPADPAGLLAQPLPQCPDPARFDIASWGDDSATGREISKYRRGLIDEFDDPDPAAITDLARHYLFLTFGAEAVWVARNFPGRMQDEAVVRGIAALLDNAPDRYSDALVTLVPCGQILSLWGVLSAPEPADLRDVPVNSILASFTGLPLHIRRHLGPELADRFVSMREEAAARTVIASITRAPGDHGAGVELARLETAVDAAPDDFSMLLDAPPAQAARAVLGALTARLAGDQPIPQSEVETAAAFAFEFRANPIGRDLKLAELRSRLRLGQYRTAFDGLEEAMDIGLVSEEDRAAVSVELLDMATETTESVDFLALAEDVAPYLLSAERDEAVRVRAATRALELGFSGLAQDLLGRDYSSTPALSQARATLLLLEGNTVGAQTELAVIPVDQPTPLVAEVLALNAQYDAAARTFRALGSERDARIAAIRSQDWDLISQYEIPGVSVTDASEISQSVDALPLDERPSAVLDVATAARETVEALLGTAAPGD